MWHEYNESTMSYDMVSVFFIVIFKLPQCRV